jgi:RecA-family ATPase
MTSNIEETDIPRPVTQDEGDPGADPEAPEPPKPHAIVEAWQTLGELGDVFGEKPPRRRWLLKHGDDGVLPLGKVAILAAAGGVGKTMACVQLALAVATGRKWLATVGGVGGFTVAPEGAGRVLLALGEEDVEEVRRRIYHAGLAMGLTADEHKLARDRIVALPLAGHHVAFTDAAGQETAAATQLREKMQGVDVDGWRLVIFDPLSRFAGPDAEVDNSAATRFIETAETFCKLPGAPTVFIVHHSAQAGRGKDRPKDRDASHVSRGATGITDGARWVAALDDERVEGVDEHLRRLAVLEVVKNNYAPWRHERITLRRNADHGGALHVLDAADEASVDEAKKPANTKREPAKATGLG